MPIRQQTAEEAYLAVLDSAGCSLPNRDAIDKRIIQEVRTGTATMGNNGIISKPGDVGGWPKLKSAAAPADGDHDGMPDAWETDMGFNPNDASDGARDRDSDGYTNLEEYINGLVTSSVSQATAGPTDGRPRVIATSDGEIDDECSMVRFLLYTNKWDIEAIVTSSSQYHWHGLGLPLRLRRDQLLTPKRLLLSRYLGRLVDRDRVPRMVPKSQTALILLSKRS
jgi:hypothetical protein